MAPPRFSYAISNRQLRFALKNSRTNPSAWPTEEVGQRQEAIAHFTDMLGRYKVDEAVPPGTDHDDLLALLQHYDRDVPQGQPHRCEHKKGWSQEALALECGLHRTFVAHVERLRRNASLDNIERMAQALGVPVRDLFAPVFHEQRQ